jgi:hypothetical protein
VREVFRLTKADASGTNRTVKAPRLTRASSSGRGETLMRSRFAHPWREKRGFSTRRGDGAVDLVVLPFADACREKPAREIRDTNDFVGGISVRQLARPPRRCSCSMRMK